MNTEYLISAKELGELIHRKTNRIINQWTTEHGIKNVGTERKPLYNRALVMAKINGVESEVKDKMVTEAVVAEEKSAREIRLDNKEERLNAEREQLDYGKEQFEIEKRQTKERQDTREKELDTREEEIIAQEQLKETVNAELAQSNAIIEANHEIVSQIETFNETKAEFEQYKTDNENNLKKGFAELNSERKEFEALIYSVDKKLSEADRERELKRYINLYCKVHGLKLASQNPVPLTPRDLPPLEPIYDDYYDDYPPETFWQKFWRKFNGG